MPSHQLPPSPHLPPTQPAPSLAHCSIVPPYLLEALASSDDPRAAEHAQATLAVDAELRQDRRTGSLRPTTGRAPRQRLAPGTTAGPQRAVHDAKHGTTLPGTLVRSEGDPPTGDRAVTEAYDGLGDTWHCWQQAYGRNSLDGKGLPLVASVHYGTQLRQRVLGRHPDGLRRRRRPSSAVHPQRRRHRPRADPRGHPVHRRPELPGPVRRAQRVVLRRLRRARQAAALGQTADRPTG